MKRSPLIRRTSMVRTGRLQPVSKKRQAINRLRRKVLHDEYGDNPPCFVCQKPARDGHELLSRGRGGSIVDPANIRPVCGDCHHRITTRPMWAESLMFALPSPPRHKEQP